MDAGEQNGFAIFLDALRLISCPRQISEASSNKPADSLIKHREKNALSKVYYLKDDIDPPEGVPKPETLDRPYTLEEKQAVLRANKSAIAKFKLSFHSAWPDTLLYDDGESIVFYTMCRLITLQGAVFTAQNRFTQAAEALLDCVDVAVRLSPYNILKLDPLFSYSLLPQCYRNLQTIEENFGPQDYRSILDRMSQIAKRYQPYWKTWQPENNIYFSNLKEECSNSGWRLYAAISLSRRKTWIFLFLKLLAYNRQRFITALETEYSNTVKQAINHFPISEQLVTNSWLKFYWLSPEHMSSFQLDSLRTRVIFDLIMLRWAVRAYKDEISKYPASLADLVPDYLDVIPTDPFSKGDTYRYRTDGDKYLLYSVGPDGIDSGGSPIEGKIASGQKMSGDITDYDVFRKNYCC